MDGGTNEAAAPKPACKLVGTDGNVFAIIGRVKQARMRVAIEPEPTVTPGAPVERPGG
jgi:hypothetical protein